MATDSYAALKLRPECMRRDKDWVLIAERAYYEFMQDPTKCSLYTAKFEISEMAKRVSLTDFHIAYNQILNYRLEFDARPDEMVRGIMEQFFSTAMYSYNDTDDDEVEGE